MCPPAIIRIDVSNEHRPAKDGRAWFEDRDLLLSSCLNRGLDGLSRPFPSSLIFRVSSALSLLENEAASLKSCDGERCILLGRKKKKNHLLTFVFPVFRSTYASSQ